MNKVSKTEDMLYEAMLDIGLRPERQYSFKEIEKYGYSLDFAFLKEKINIEVDGTGGNFEHHLTESRRRKDNTRDDVLQSLGWKVRRFTDKEVWENPNEVVRKISHFINKDNQRNKKLDNWEENRELKREVKSVKIIPKRIISRGREEELKKIIKEVKGRKSVGYGKRNKKKYLVISIVILIILFFGYLILNINPKERTQNDPDNAQNVNSIPEKPEPIIVTGSKTDVIIKNNQEKSISLNVTYNVYSKWFGKDSTESQIFEVGPKDEKSFQVYFNDGCNTAPCSVSIINYNEI